MERIISDQMWIYLQQNNLISNNQYGFRKGRSTSVQLLESYNDWVNNQNSGFSTDVIYLDFCKAFDSVVHSKLIAKLASYGIGNELLTWIKNFLTDRSHTVTIQYKQSDSRAVLSGVPQGTVLGPLLFVIYINDITDVIDHPVIMKLFADDIKIYTRITSIKDCLEMQRQLSAIITWSLIWQLKLNAKKCNVLHLGRSNYNYSYYIEQSILSSPTVVNDLGIFINSDLNFHHHIEHVITECHKKIFFLRKCFLFKSSDIRKHFYTAYIRPILEYGSLVWCPWSKHEIDLLQNIQNKALGTARNMLQPLTTRRNVHDLLMYYRIVHGNCNIKFSDFFSLRSELNHRGHNYTLQHPLVHTSAFQHTFAYRQLRTWNSLPSNIVNSTSVTSFKQNVQQLFS
jgi:hypothetical protein